MIKRLLVFVCVLAVFALLPYPVFAKSFYFPWVEITAQINADRSVDFVEERTFAFDGSFTQIYWDIPLETCQTYQASQTCQTISEVSVSEISPGGQEIPYEEIGYVDPGRPAHKFAAVRQGESEHIEAWHLSGDETKTFVLNYHLTNAVSKHPDVAEFYWKVIGDSWGASGNC